MDQAATRPHLERFLDSEVRHPTLALVYGRRRIGKSTLLDELIADRGGFYWEATRGESAMHLTRLGEALGQHLGTIGEAKAGETLGTTRLRHLERARAALGARAAHARLLLFAPAFTAELQATAAHRGDTELVDLDRLYHGD